MKRSLAVVEEWVVYIRAQAILETVSMPVTIYLCRPFLKITMLSKATRNPGFCCFCNSMVLRLEMDCFLKCRSDFLGLLCKRYFSITSCTFQEEMGWPNFLR